MNSLGALFLDAAGLADICEDCCGDDLSNCNCTAGDTTTPRVAVTLSWTDTDTTKNYLGCTWSNGEKKQICPTTYQNTTTGTASKSEEDWIINDQGIIRLAANTDFEAPNDENGVLIRVQFPSEGNYQVGKNSTTTSIQTSSISTENISEAALSEAAITIQDNFFGQMTTTSGITVKWERMTPAQSISPGTGGYWRISAP